MNANRITSLVCTTAAILAGSQISTLGQSDNFDDGNDTGWTRYDPISQAGFGARASYTFPNGAYRISTLASPAPGLPPNGVGPARVGSIRQDITYTNFYCAVDIVDWDENAADPAFGLIARIKTPGLGQTDGYAMTFDFGAGGNGDLDITRFTDEGNFVAVGTDSGPADEFQMVKGERYRFVFFGRGNQLTAHAYRYPDLRTPLATVSGPDPDPNPYTHGFCGLLIYDNSSARTGTADITFDNYFAAGTIPPLLQTRRFEDRSFEVSWPSEDVGFKLEGTTNLTAPVVWQDLRGEVFELDGRFIYVDDGLSDQKFFRLVEDPGIP